MISVILCAAEPVTVYLNPRVVSPFPPKNETDKNCIIFFYIFMSSKIQKKTNSFIRNSVCRAVIQSFIRSVSHLCVQERGMHEMLNVTTQYPWEVSSAYYTRVVTSMPKQTFYRYLWSGHRVAKKFQSHTYAAVFVLQLRFFLRSHIGIHANSFFFLRRSKNERQKPKREEESSFPMSVRCRQKAISLEPFVRCRRMVSDSQPSNKFVSLKRDNNGYMLCSVKVSVGPFRPTWSDPNRQ